MDRTCLVLVASLLVAVGGCVNIAKDGSVGGKSSTAPAYWPTDGWKTATPESQGFDSLKLAEMLRFIRDRNIRLHSMQIVRNGWLVLDARFYPFSSVGPLHDLASATKSVTSALVGIAVDKGQIQHIDQPLLSFFPGYKIGESDRGKEQIRLRDLVSMSSGLDCGFSPGEPELFRMLQSGNFIQSALDLHMVHKPGEKWAYCSGNMHLLSGVITKTTGESALAFARKHLFHPLGKEQIEWPSDPQGITHGWGDLQLSPHDMARIGYLYLNQGVWNGRRVISSSWVRESTKTRFHLPSGEGYGYGWWTAPESPLGEIYNASGRGGQKIYIVPGKQLVLVLTGNGYDLTLIQQHLIDAIPTARRLPENATAHRQLREQIDAVSRPPDPKPVPPLPDIAMRISGKRYRLEKNLLDLDTVSLSFDGSNRAIAYIYRAPNQLGGEKAVAFPVGLDDVAAISSDGLLGKPSASKGYWRSDTEFALHLDLVSMNRYFTFGLQFEGNRIIITTEEQDGFPPERIQGYIVTETVN